MKKKHLFRLVMAALITLMGFASCSKVLYGKREKQAKDDTPEPRKERVPDIRVVHSLPDDGRAIRVLYGVPPRSYKY